MGRHSGRPLRGENMKRGIISFILLAIIPSSTFAQTPNPVTINSASAGDVACYLEVTDASGTAQSLMADFSICERTDLDGKKATLTYSKQNVLADSCQGNPDCSDSKTVDLVTKVNIQAP